ncbi:hypothetical protein ABK040_003440 [Willaertia magna]
MGQRATANRSVLELSPTILLQQRQSVYSTNTTNTSDSVNNTDSHVESTMIHLDGLVDNNSKPGSEDSTSTSSSGSTSKKTIGSKRKQLNFSFPPLTKEEIEEAKERKQKRLELEEQKRLAQLQITTLTLQKKDEFKHVLEKKRAEVMELKQKKNEVYQEKQSARKRLNDETKLIHKGATEGEEELTRIMKVHSYKILDTSPNEHFDDIVDICMKVFDVPAALVTFVDEYRIWFKSSRGFEFGKETQRNIGFCGHTILRNDILLLNDTTKDSRFIDNPFVINYPNVSFYAGCPLITEDGYRVGVLVLIDFKPRYDFDDMKKQFLKKLAGMVVRELELFKEYDTALQNEKFQRSIIEFEKQIQSYFDKEDVVDLATLTIAENLEIDYVETYQLGGNNKYELSGSFYWGCEEAKTILDDKMFQFIMDKPKQTITIDSIAINKEGFELSENGKQMGVKSFLSCKVSSDETLHGFINVYKKTNHIWFKEEIDFLEQFGNSLAKMIDREIARTKFLEEQLKSEKLLANILPTTICERLKENNQEIIADKVRNATVMFCDIVGFTTLTKNQNCPSATVEFLNYLFSEFDKIIEKHNVEKIKTIGDCLMVSSGLLGQEEDHAICMIDFALDILSFIQSDIVQKKYPINVRIGISTGEVCAGCIGKKKNTYDIWGDAVNLASRMESHGKPGRIHTTIKTLSHLTQHQLQMYDIEERGTIKVKGVGKMKTFFINGKVLNGDIKILTFPSKIKEIYGIGVYFFGIKELNELLMYKINHYNNNKNNYDCETILQNLQNKKIDKITVSYGACLVLTKSKELFAFGNNEHHKFNINQLSIDIFTKIELKKEITENVIDIQMGSYNTLTFERKSILYLW